MTLVEFLSPVISNSHRDKVLAALYYYERFMDVDAMTPDQIKKALIGARIPKASKINVSDVLSKSGHLVDASGVNNSGKKLWQLTITGQKDIRRVLGLPDAEVEIEQDVTILTKILPTIRDANARDFAQEAIRCLQAGLMRPAIVFLWSGAVVIMRARAFSYGVVSLNATLQKFDPRARRVSAISHLDYVKDATLLMVLCELGEIDKGQKTTLEEALNLRNRCGHPTSYRPGPAKTSSFIEDVVGLLF